MFFLSWAPVHVFFWVFYLYAYAFGCCVPEGMGQSDRMRTSDIVTCMAGFAGLVEQFLRQELLVL